MPDGIQLAPTVEANTQEVRARDTGRAGWIASSYDARIQTAQLVQREGRVVSGQGAQLSANIDKIKAQKQQNNDNADHAQFNAYRTRRMGEMNRTIRASPGDEKAQNGAFEAFSRDMDGYIYGKNAQGNANFRNPLAQSSAANTWRQDYESLRNQFKEQQLIAQQQDTATRFHTTQSAGRVSYSEGEYDRPTYKGFTEKNADGLVEAGALTPAERDSWVQNELDTGQKGKYVNRLRGLEEEANNAQVAGKPFDFAASMKETQELHDTVKTDPHLGKDAKLELMGITNEVMARRRAQIAGIEAAAKAADIEKQKSVNTQMMNGIIDLTKGNSKLTPDLITKLSNGVATSGLIPGDREKAYKMLEDALSEYNKPKVLTPEEQKTLIHGLAVDIAIYNPETDPTNVKRLDLVQQIQTSGLPEQTRTSMMHLLRNPDENPDNLSDIDKQSMTKFGNMLSQTLGIDDTSLKDKGPDNLRDSKYEDKLTIHNQIMTDMYRKLNNGIPFPQAQREAIDSAAYRSASDDKKARDFVNQLTLTGPKAQESVPRKQRIDFVKDGKPMTIIVDEKDVPAIIEQLKGGK